MKEINKVIQDYKDKKLTAAEANAKLKELGAEFSVGEIGEGGWSAAEMAEGFLPGKPAGKVQRGPDMSRKLELAGQTVTQYAANGTFSVEYDSDGYAKKATLVK